LAVGTFWASRAACAMAILESSSVTLGCCDLLVAGFSPAAAVARPIESPSPAAAATPNASIRWGKARQAESSSRKAPKLVDGCSKTARALAPARIKLAFKPGRYFR